MPITVTQKFQPRPSSLGDNASVETTWIVAGTDDDVAAKYALRDATPVWYDGLVRNNLHIDIIGPDTWEGTVTYGRRQEEPLTGESSFSFDTGGGTQHITQSLQNIANYPGLAANYKGAIGVTHDNVEGVDITVPIYKFSETHYLSASLVTYGYRGQLFYLTGKVNNAPFKGCAAGECLFLGASGSERTKGATPADGDWEITYNFAASPNATNLTVGTITGIAKKGWEYMWVVYVDDIDPNANKLVKVPWSVHIEQVYQDGNFALLGIGS